MSKREQQQYDQHKLPWFYRTNKFPPLTHDQRDILFRLIILSKIASFRGEYQWCVRTEPPGFPPEGFVTGIKSTSAEDGSFDFDHPLYNPEKQSIISERSIMMALSRFGYVVISDITLIANNKTKQSTAHAATTEYWTQFTITQLGYDYYNYSQTSIMLKPFIALWHTTQDHMLSLAFGILGAVLVDLVKSLLLP